MATRSSNFDCSFHMLLTFDFAEIEILVGGAGDLGGR